MVLVPPALHCYPFHLLLAEWELGKAPSARGWPWKVLCERKGDLYMVQERSKHILW